MKAKLLEFKNNKGEKIHIKGSATISDLVKMGVTDIHITKPEAPLPDGWWKNKK